MKIYAFTDYMATLGQSKEEEYEQIRQILSEIIEMDFVWKIKIHLFYKRHNASDTPEDLRIAEFPEVEND